MRQSEIFFLNYKWVVLHSDRNFFQEIFNDCIMIPPRKVTILAPRAHSHQIRGTLDSQV